jgi:hypothetical protein
MSTGFFPSRRSALIAIALCCASLPRQAVAAGKSASAVGFDVFDRLLRRYVVPGHDGVNRVDYGGLAANKADRSGLRRFIEAQSTVNPTEMSAAEAFAYWANLYNALTLDVVLNAYPVTSIRNIKSRGAGFDLKALFGPWRTKLVTVAGRRLSLDDIEHEIMRPTFRDPRVHIAVNCAAVGCPNLWPQAWRAASLNDDLDRAARTYVNHPRGALVQPDGSLTVSSIYKSYAEDFGGTDTAIIEHLKKYARPEFAAEIKPTARLVSHRYDWSLNDVRDRDATR